MTEPSPELPDEQPPKAEATEQVDAGVEVEERKDAAVKDGEVAASSSEGAAANKADTVAGEDSTEADDNKSLGDEDEEDEEEEEEDDEEDDNDEEEEDEEDEEDEEPRLNYVRMTQNVASVYRNGDATSTFLVAGDKLIVGTHNGNIHVIQLPTFRTLRVYHAHSASVTSISISPYPPPLPTENELAPKALPPAARDAEPTPTTPKKSREPQQLPKIPSNDIYIATSSMDGNVCIQSLLDVKDVQLRNFGRPVQCVALSPEYKSDKTFLSGGLAGQLVLTVGAAPGRSTSTTTGTAAATAAGWLGSVGLSASTAKDTVIHSGEGTVSCIKWSLSGKYVMWLNEHGIKIMRSKLHLESANLDDAWKRIGHIDRPETDEWETMASVWKGRAEWIDEKSLEVDNLRVGDGEVAKEVKPVKASVERLLVGWGGTIWIVHVHDGRPTKRQPERTAGKAEIVKILRMDCIISGLALYTKSLLLVLAFCHPDEDDEEEEERKQSRKKGRESIGSTSSEPSGGIRRKQNNLPPELRLIDLDSQTEVDKYSLPVSRYERLFAADYHLGVLPARSAASVIASKGALETLTGLGADMWHAAINPKALFSSGASVFSHSSDNDTSSKVHSASGTLRSTPSKAPPPVVDPGMAKPGAKIFIQSPYDCILATKRDLTDHLKWLIERKEYGKAWELLDENPEILTAPFEKQHGHSMSTSSQPGIKEEDFFYEESVADSTTARLVHSATEKEKRRVGELWIQQLVEQGDWKSAGATCGKVLATADKWEKWVWAFAGANKFDEIVDYIPSAQMTPPIPTTVYEVVLGHYIQSDKVRFGELLNLWPLDLFDTKAVAKALENQLKFRDVREDSIEGGERGRDWKIVTESLARLYETGGRHREALKCFIKLHDADNAFRLIKDNHLAEAVVDDIPAFISLRVTTDELDSMSEDELAEATSEAIALLVDEAQHGLVPPKTIVDQLQAKQMPKYLFFYLRALWRGDGVKDHVGPENERILQESKVSVDEFADLAIHLFASYDRNMLMDMLKTSTAYTFDKAVQECEKHEYYDELVYLYSKTGQMKRALYLIIDRLHDVQKAIDFAKEQDDPDLWEVLLSYSMDKPTFIRALLEQVGTAINPITLVKRIPAGLEIEGLREGLIHMMKEHELQHSISHGVAKVLRSEVGATQSELRAGQRRGVKFEPAEWKVLPAKLEQANGVQHDPETPAVKPGHCAQCHEPFTEYEMETLLGYSCGHVFHLSHLLELLHNGQADVDLGGNSMESSRYLVGMKVMKARLLRDKVKGGCPLCHTK